MKILITGGSGFVGSEIARLLGGEYFIDAPSRLELDITKPRRVNSYVIKFKPDYIINAAAFTDLDDAGREQGKRSGDCYRINVDGTHNILKAADVVRARVITVSTGSVFHGTEKSPGPFAEHDPIASPKTLTWYAATKAYGEELTLKFHQSVARISHPVSAFDGEDYIHKYIDVFRRGHAYPLFTDQWFPLTGMKQFAEGLKKIMTTHASRVFHFVSDDLVTPYDLFTFVFRRLKLPRAQLKRKSFASFIRVSPNPKRYSKYSALSGTYTRELLGLPGYSWKDAVETNMA